MWLRNAIVPAVIVALSCGVVVAEEIGPFGLVQVSWGDGQIWSSDAETLGTVSQSMDGSYEVSGGFDAVDWSAEWMFEVGGSTGVSSNIAVTSTVDFTETFNFTVFINSPVAIAGPTLLAGSASVNVSDNVLQGLPGATVSATDGGAAYRAMINGEVWGTLMDDPFALSADAGETNSDGPFFFSDAAGPAVAMGDVIAIQHEFTLTAFDIAQFAGTFTVPEPSTALLLGLGFSMMLRRRR